MKRGLIIGYGNPLRKDDGVGWHVAQQFQDELFAASVSILALHQLTPELAEDMSQADLVILIDAEEGTVPGAIQCRRIEPQPAATSAFTHQFDPPTLLALVQEFFAVCPTVYLLTVCGGDFGYGEEFSPPVRAALPELKTQVITLLQSQDVL
ncbi:MAG: hydrogenase maturation protease [bacterium]|jgi:hydrogenase maturation protease|nr:hydrogenase maturation protease [bacterium]